MLVEVLVSQDFRLVVPNTPGTWANTPEGEWTASIDSTLRAPSRDDPVLRVAGQECRLAGLSVARPAQDELVLRLNFDGCQPVAGGATSAEAGARHAAIVVPLRRSEVNGCSNLVDWMCALMPHSVCWPPLTTTTPVTTTTTLAGNIRMQVQADYDLVGPGLCFAAKAVEEEDHPHAGSVVDCAVECLSGNTYALRTGGGRRCTGFAFGAAEMRRCIVYRSNSAEESPTTRSLQEQASGWSCFTLRRTHGGAVNHPPAALLADAFTAGASVKAPVSQTPTLPPAQVVPKRPRWSVLKLDCELGSKCFAAKRQRLTPLVPGCYQPLDWITLGGGGGGGGDGGPPGPEPVEPIIRRRRLDGVVISASSVGDEDVTGAGQRAGGSGDGTAASAAAAERAAAAAKAAAVEALAPAPGPSLAINASTWQYLMQQLPIVQPGREIVDGVISSDFICVDFGGVGCCKAPPLLQMAERPFDSTVPTFQRGAWWTYAATALSTALFTVPITVSIMYHLMKRVTYTLIETDADDPSRSRTVGSGNSWHWHDKGGYVPFPRKP